MQEQLFKSGLASAGVGTIVTFMAGNYTPLIILLIFFEVADYISGVYSAWTKGELNSRAATEGFFKKFFYFFLIAVAFGFDYMIYEVTETLGFNFKYPAIFGIFSVCYLLSTELISIVENLGKLGIVFPFLTKALKAFRCKIDDMYKDEEENR